MKTTSRKQYSQIAPLRDAGIQELPIFVPIDYHVIVQAPSTTLTNRHRFKLLLWFCVALGSILVAFDKFVIDEFGSKLAISRNNTNETAGHVKNNKKNETDFDTLAYFQESDDDW
jgi:hypothetical protein